MSILGNMKTTIDIPDSLLIETRRIAERRGTTIKTIVESALRSFLESQKRAKQMFTLQSGSFKGHGLQEGLKEGDWNHVLSSSYQGRGG